MPPVDEQFLLGLLRAIAELAPGPLYPARFAQQQNLERTRLDEGLDELRRRSLIAFTDWVKDLGQGYALTEAGQQALTSGRLTYVPRIAEETIGPKGVSTYERGEIVRRAIFEPKQAFVTRILLIANLCYFAVGAGYAALRPGLSVSDYLLGDGVSTSEVLIALGALHPALVFPDKLPPEERVPSVLGPLENLLSSKRPQFERLLFLNFLHIGLLHLAMNMYFLATIAKQIEVMWGWARFLAIYIVAGLVSGCVIMLLGEIAQRGGGRTGLTAGASGCLYGVFASMIVWFSLNYQHLPDRLVQDWSRGTMINMILLIAINFVPGISWQGHFGGAVGGLLAGLLLHAQRFHPSRAVRWLALAGVPAAPVLFFVAVLWQAGRL